MSLIVPLLAEKNTRCNIIKNVCEVPFLLNTLLAQHGKWREKIETNGIHYHLA